MSQIRDITQFMRQDADYDHEMMYWRDYVFAELDGPYAKGEQIIARMTPEQMHETFPDFLTPYLDNVRAETGTTPTLLDVGCGPASIMAYGAHQGLLALTALDPLADQYRNLTQSHGYAPEYPLIQGYGEELTQHFAPASFDITWTRNAIDHALDPHKVLSEMVSVTRPGGYVFLWVHTREATYENWNGLHQHDIYQIPSGDLVCETRKANRTCLMTQGLPLEVVERSEPTLEVRQELRMIWRKTS